MDSHGHRLRAATIPGCPETSLHSCQLRGHPYYWPSSGSGAPAAEDVRCVHFGQRTGAAGIVASADCCDGG